MMNKNMKWECQFSILKKCAEIMIKPIGEMWKDNEVLYHLLPGGIVDEKEQLLISKMLFEQ